MLRHLLLALAPLYVVAAVVLLVDQVSKTLVIALLGTQIGSYRPLIDDLLWLRMVHNSGAAFGMLQNASILFALAAVAVTAGILFYSRKLSSMSLLVRLAIGLELGGALGNLIDRARYGYVVDFIDVRLWPFVFNVSDAAITIGVVLLLYHFLFRTGGDSPRATEQERQAGDKPA